MSVKPIRESFHTVTPYLVVTGVPRLIEFISHAFQGELTFRKERPDGTVMHAEMRVGDSMLMMGEASDSFGPRPISIYLYVPDCDAVYRQALAAGGVAISEVKNMPSGERYGGIEDPCGNIWWVATHVEDVPPEEEDRRWKEYRG